MEQNNSILSFFQNSDFEYIELFNIKFYFDDLLILCLLFFLYKEDVHDDFLYVILIALLLT